ncbi:5,6-dimethylbenzimidazole synthase [Roseivivax isoporae]|uniref:Cob(II)yrinic acid a,c-diamide reductase n=1 Tax=Roseivivax isoporae LMG 25204 TaxID=1449351 RepID=X7F5Q2_9RHOB|nr:5,6-dimethylbenzimidazole synthase [Roseivivax isoporae]ETX28028.1 cob(II)yrinic acid a,c-diamide reductase [Roseivivax isoporae LMG 25204]
MEFSSEDRARLKALMTWRRDVRHFRTDPLDPALVARLAEAMALAPSVGNARPWRVIRVEDPAVRTAIRDEFARCTAAAEAAYAGARRKEYAALKLAGLDRAPLQLSIFCDTDPEEGHGLGRATMPETLMQSTAMAVYALMLAARAENVGAGLVSILSPDVMARILDVPPRWRFATHVCLGYPEAVDDTPLLHRAGWQENAEPEWETR